MDEGVTCRTIRALSLLPKASSVNVCFLFSFFFLLLLLFCHLSEIMQPEILDYLDVVYDSHKSANMALAFCFCFPATFFIYGNLAI